MAKAKRSFIKGYDLDDPEQTEILMKEVMGKVRKGESLREALDLSATELEAAYALAYHKYHAGEYRQAAELFEYLVALDNKCYKYLLGFAASVQKLGDIPLATQVYMWATLHAKNDPTAYYHAAQCLLEMDLNERAFVMLCLAVQQAGKQKAFSELKKRAQLMIDALKPQIESESKPSNSSPA